MAYRTSIPVMASTLQPRWDESNKTATSPRKHQDSIPPSAAVEYIVRWRPCVRNPLFCQCLSEETLQAVGHFYLLAFLSGVHVRGSKISHQSALEICNLSWTPHSSLEKDNSLNQSCVSLKMGCLHGEVYT